MIPGILLTDPGWLADRVADTRRRWALTESRVAATLWWYSASSVLLAQAPADLLRTGGAPDPRLTGLSVTTTADGTLADATAATRVAGPDEFAAALCGTLTSIVGVLASVSGAGAAALWAVASDSLGNRALEAGAALGSPVAGSALAAALAARIGAPMPSPRFVDVGAGRQVAADPTAEPAVGVRRYLRRNSCCLIYRSPALAPSGDPDAAERAKCVSCPHQRPEVRRARLAAL